MENATFTKLTNFKRQLSEDSETMEILENWPKKHFFNDKKGLQKAVSTSKRVSKQQYQQQKQSKFYT